MPKSKVGLGPLKTERETKMLWKQLTEEMTSGDGGFLMELWRPIKTLHSECARRVLESGKGSLTKSHRYPRRSQSESQESRGFQTIF